MVRERARIKNGTVRDRQLKKQLNLLLGEGSESFFKGT
jgi:hypothetical protein